MARHDDALTDLAAKRIGMDEEVATSSIHRLSQRVIALETTNAALRNALTRYRVQHDGQQWSHDRPCRCELCQQADEAIKAAKGNRYVVP